MRRLLAISLLALTPSLVGCEAISKVVGAFTAMKDVAQNLEEDLAAPLTNESIDKVIEVIPKLEEFSKEAKVRWKPDPAAHDFSELGNNLGALSDYAAFFESHDTRLTRFYVDLIKIHDARAQILFDRQMKESRGKFDERERELQDKLASAEADQKASIEQQLEQVRLARGKLDEAREQAERHRTEVKKNTKGSYQIRPEERALVEARLDEIAAVFQAHGYEKGRQKDVAQGT